MSEEELRIQILRVEAKEKIMRRVRFYLRIVMMGLFVVAILAILRGTTIIYTPSHILVIISVLIGVPIFITILLGRIIEYFTIREVEKQLSEIEENN